MTIDRQRPEEAARSAELREPGSHTPRSISSCCIVSQPSSLMRADREDDDRWGQYPIAGVLCTKVLSVSCLARKSATSAREMKGRRPGLRPTLAL